jgi:hypothetical protein
MTDDKPKKTGRGGAREGAGRCPDYRKRCEIYAIMVSLAISESQARRILREWDGNLKAVIGSTEYFKVLQTWDELEEFDKGMVYGALGARVHDMLARGIGRRV